MKALVTLRLENRSALSTFRNSEKRVSFCHDTFCKLFGEVDYAIWETDACILRVYRRYVPHAIKVYAKLDPEILRSKQLLWGETKDEVDNVILQGDHVFVRFLSDKPRAFWLTIDAK